MIEKKSNGIAFLQFSILAEIPGLHHGIFTRRGGASQAPFDSLNVCLAVGDSPDNVAENRRAIRRMMHNNPLLFLEQVHGDTVLVYRKDSRRPLDSFRMSPPQGDAVITDVENVNLTIQTADCQAVILYDPKQKIAANIHSGWRGSIQNVIGSTVEKMAREFGSNARDIAAGIGPSLGPCCAEFVRYRQEIPEIFWKYKTNGHYFDFWSLSRDQLMTAGVRENKIEQSRLCTRCRTDLFFSYRAEKTTGRFASVIGFTH